MSCAGGASVKSGVDPDQLVPVDRSLWESVTGAPASWLDPILDTFTQEWIKTSDLCALNLSDPGLPSTADLIAAATNPATIPAGVYTWVRDKLRYVQFAQQCECVGGPGVCDTFDTGCQVWPEDGADHYFYIHDLGSDVSGGSVSMVVCGGWDFGRDWTYNVWATYPDGTGAYQVAQTRVLHTTPDLNFTLPFGAVTPGKTKLSTAVRIGGGGGNAHIQFTGSVNCAHGPATTPSAPAQPSQPPDLTLAPAWSCSTTGDLCTRLQQIDQRLRSIQEYVTLIQRQRVPFAYVSGASFTASGNGSHAVQGILGLSVSFTTLPSGRSNYPDNPDSYFDLGWLSLCTADGCEAARPLRRQVELILDVSPAVTSVRWSLPSGAAATIMPLVREP